MLFRQRSKSALREGAARKESFEFSLPFLARSPRFALFSSSSCGGPVATHKGNSIPLLIPPLFKREASAASAAAVVCLLWRLFPPRVRGWRKTAVFVYWGGRRKGKSGSLRCARRRAPVLCVLCVPPSPPPSFCVPCGRRRRLVAGNGGGGGGRGRRRLSRLLLWRKSLPPPSPEGVRRRELLHSFFSLRHLITARVEE